MDEKFFVQANMGLLKAKQKTNNVHWKHNFLHFSLFFKLSLDQTEFRGCPMYCEIAGYQKKSYLT